MAAKPTTTVTKPKPPTQRYLLQRLVDTQATIAHDLNRTMNNVFRLRTLVEAHLTTTPPDEQAEPEAPPEETPEETPSAPEPPAPEETPPAA